ncbi:ABC transporter-like domain protein [mine drainage metagenome]|uniref:ABC transporter-like domain protein n=1 Tax=mine drainage metagenome TaxID=410659 RepID=T1D646_9ZZZZ
MDSETVKPIVSFQDVEVDYDGKPVLEGIGFDVLPGEIVGLVGTSGSGKTTLLRHLIGLNQPTRGEILIFGERLNQLPHTARAHLRQRIGVLFQGGALFSSLTVFENIALPLRERGLQDPWIQPMVCLALSFAGLPPDAALLMPSELSGGMVTRVALARCLVIEPELLLLDEPTSGLDPIVSDAFIAVMLKLQKNIGISVLMISHDLRTLKRLCHRVVIVGEGHLLAQGRIDSLQQSRDPRIRAFFRLDEEATP